MHQRNSDKIETTELPADASDTTLVSHLQRDRLVVSVPDCVLRLRPLDVDAAFAPRVPYSENAANGDGLTCVSQYLT
jgi:hypothetical protein